MPESEGVQEQRRAKVLALAATPAAELAEAVRVARSVRGPLPPRYGPCPYLSADPEAVACRWCSTREARACRVCRHQSYLGAGLCLRWACRCYVHTAAVAYTEALGIELQVPRDWRTLADWRGP